MAYGGKFAAKISAVLVKNTSSFSVDWKPFQNLEANSRPNESQNLKKTAVLVKNTSSFSVDWKPSLWRLIRGQISQNFGRPRQEHIKL